MPSQISTAEIVRRAYQRGIVVPAFNIPYLPMLEPIVRALRNTRSFGLIAVARLEWVKFESGSLQAVAAEYARHKDSRFMRLHLDHVPVIDEDNLQVDYLPIIRQAIEAGYESVMVDGSRLPLDKNIAATAAVAKLAHAAGVAVEGELGAVMGHEEGPMPSYEELFASGRGFTDPREASQFVRQTGVDWLSVAVGSVHGAVSKARKDEKKVEARLHIARLQEIKAAINIPLVLHGGSGIQKSYIRRGIQSGIAKINVGTALRQPFERNRAAGIRQAQEAVYQAAIAQIKDELGMTDSAAALFSA